METKICVVPGRICRVSVPDNSTVLDIAAAAAREVPEVQWVLLAKDRQVRVSGKLFSNTSTIDEVAGYRGSVQTTPIAPGEDVLILKKIKGNDGFALVCFINGVEYGLATPDEVGKVIAEVTDIPRDRISKILMNGVEVHETQLVSDGCLVQVVLREKPEPVESEDEAEKVRVVIDGEDVDPADIEVLRSESGKTIIIVNE